MDQVVDLEKARRESSVRRGYRNWRSRFGEEFGEATRAKDLSASTLLFLSQGTEETAFYLYDLIMNLLRLGSGFEIRELSPEDRIGVMDRYLFLLDRLRFELMRRLGWVDAYPGENHSLAELITSYQALAPAMQARVPDLSSEHPDYPAYCAVTALEKESFIRKLIPAALEAFSR
ncbi:MAG: hypothetical protein ACQET7_14155 [Thermodesulfobacteriota bacterium]